ncbi:MAG TPA: HEAT repeat domain-containing protein [Polyangia bacterium]|jgi:HEAT repeat protein|nr:HEAT repeat domain-containing protein [Polyangia bacterium]
MLAFWLSAALSVLLAGPAAPAGRPDRAAVEARLRANTLPSSAADWRELGPGVDEVLIAIAGDAKADLQLGAHAVSALGVVSTRLGRAYLETVVKQKASSTDAGDKLLLRKAVLALGWAGGTLVPAQIGPLLEHPDPDVRLDVAIGLGLTRSEEAADLLRKRFDVETVPKVRSQIGRQLRLIEDAVAEARRPPPAAP